MADPKYANLPGIDTESKDVYESGDLPEEDQDYVPEELNSTSVELVDTKGAFEKFSGKYISGQGKDFSGKIQHAKMTGYNASEFGLAASGDTETIFQKFNRLKMEVGDLLSDVNKIRESKSKNTQTVNLVQQVESLQMQLLDGKIDDISNKGIDSGTNIDEIMSKIQKSASEKPPATTQDGTYQLYLKPNQEEKQQLRVSALEQRLARLEKTLGTDTAVLNILTTHSKDGTLHEAVQVMETKLSLLDADQLPVVDSRLQAILNKVNEINKAHKVLPDQQTDINKKVTELYEIVQKWEGVRIGLPQLIDRLRALDVLHGKACDFTATLAHLETMQTKISARLETANSTQKKLEDMFKQNVAAIESNVSQLNKRIANLSK